jgi:hypothetical protein
MGMKVNGTSGLTFPDTTTLASAGQASVRAWVNFNGTGTVAIRAAYNVASITDNGTGNYTVNFDTALPDANYVPMLQNTGYLSQGATLGHLGILTIYGDFSTLPTLKTTTQLRIQSGLSYSGSVLDSIECNVAIFR